MVEVKETVVMGEVTTAAVVMEADAKGAAVVMEADAKGAAVRVMEERVVVKVMVMVGGARDVAAMAEGKGEVVEQEVVVMAAAGMAREVRAAVCLEESLAVEEQVAKVKEVVAMVVAGKAAEVVEEE